MGPKTRHQGDLWVALDAHRHVFGREPYAAVSTTRNHVKTRGFEFGKLAKPSHRNDSSAPPPPQPPKPPHPHPPSPPQRANTTRHAFSTVARRRLTNGTRRTRCCSSGRTELAGVTRCARRSLVGAGVSLSYSAIRASGTIGGSRTVGTPDS